MINPIFPSDFLNPHDWKTYLLGELSLASKSQHLSVFQDKFEPFTEPF